MKLHELPLNKFLEKKLFKIPFETGKAFLFFCILFLITEKSLAMEHKQMQEHSPVTSNSGSKIDIDEARIRLLNSDFSDSNGMQASFVSPANAKNLMDELEQIAKDKGLRSGIKLENSARTIDTIANFAK